MTWTLLIVILKPQAISMNKGYILEEIGEGLIRELTIKRKEKVLQNKKGRAKTNCTMKEEVELWSMFFWEVLQLGEFTFRKYEKTMKIQNPKDLGNKFKCWKCL